MSTTRIDRLEIKATERLAGVKAFLCLLEEAVPEYEKREQAELRKLAEKQGWEFGEYLAEREDLEHKFGFWMERFATYSVITMLYTVLEVQLHECAKSVQKRQRLPFGPDDIRERGIDGAATWLTKVGILKVKQDKVWCMLKDLQKIRNFIVHRAGDPASVGARREEIEKLCKEYKDDLTIDESPMDLWSEVKISMRLCRRFADLVEEFLGRVRAAIDAMQVPEEPNLRDG